MIPYVGDFAEDSTVYHYFNTFDSNDPSASVTITNLADTDIYVYKDGNVTDLVTDGASVVINFDARTGVHKLTIDTSVSADYAIGSDYMVLIEGTTVDAGTVTAGIFTFSIENRYNAAADDLANATDGLGALKTLIDTLTTNVATVDTVVDRIEVDTQDLQTQVGTAGAGLTNIGTIATVTNLTNLPAIPTNWITAAGIAADAIGASELAADAVTEIQSGLATPTNITSASGVTLAPTTGLGNQTANITGSVSSVTGNVDGNVTGSVGSNLELGPAEVAAELATYDGPTNTEMVAAFTEIKGATWATTDTLEAIRDRGDSAWTTGAGGTPPQLLQNTTIATLASQTSFTLTAGSADDDAYNGAVVVVTDSATSTQKAVGSVSDYVGSTKTITLSSDPAIFTMAAGDTIDIIANASTAPSAAAVRAEIDSNSTQLAAIVADTNELQTNQGNWLTVTGHATEAKQDIIDSNVDSILVDTGTTIPATIATVDSNVDAILVDTGTTLPATLTTIEGKVDTVDTVVDGIQTDLSNATDGLGAIKTDTAAILTDTGTTLPSSLTTIEGKIDTVDTNVDAVLVDTGTTIPATITTIDTVVDNLNLGIIYGAAATGTLSTTQATTDLTGYTDDQLIGRTIIVTSGVVEGEGSDITDYAETNGTLTFTAMTLAMGNGDTFKIV